MLDVKADIKQKNGLMRHLNKAIDRAITQATIDAGKFVEDKLAKTIKDELSLDDAFIERAMSLKRIPNGVEISVDSGDDSSLKVSRRRHFVPVIKYQPRQVKSGVSIKVKGKRKVMRSAFIATLPKTGYKGVFRRVKIGAKRVPRYPIKEIKWSTGIETVAADKADGVAKSTITRFKVQLSKNLNREL